jgi:hypothetical protein
MGKGGSSTKQEIPYWLEDAARRNLQQADLISRIGPVPLTYGPTVAAFAPMQNSAFANTADLASAYGLAAPVGTAVTGNMPGTVNAGGVTGYSAKPVYDAITGEFVADRPGQASYIDSFFINPFTGTTGINSGNVSDIGYQNSMPVGVDGRPIGGGGGSSNSSSSDRFAKFREKDMQEIDGKMYDMNARATDYIDGMDTPGHLDLIKGDLENMALAVTKGPKPGGRGDPTYRTGGINNPGNNPSLASMVAGAPEGMRYDPATGGYKAIKGFGDGQNISKSLKPQIRGTPKKDLSTPATDAAKKDGCVIATHAISTGAYNYQTRREAEVWCMRRLHDKWWGETIRRGYRYLGRRKIDQGKASEHYDEFKRYIAFATGKKRDLRGALTFTLRSVQFFAVGLFARNS